MWCASALKGNKLGISRLKIERMEKIMEEKYKIITVTELANKLGTKNIGESIDFTFDTTLDSEPSGWYGVKIVDLFNEPEGCIVMGYYGGGATILRCINPGEEIVEELLKEMLLELSETDTPVEYVCVDLISDNGN